MDTRLIRNIPYNGIQAISDRSFTVEPFEGQLARVNAVGCAIDGCVLLFNGDQRIGRCNCLDSKRSWHKCFRGIIDHDVQTECFIALPG